MTEPTDRHGGIDPWPYVHSIEALDRCWDAFMEATVTEGNPLYGHTLELLMAQQPYRLSQIFDLVLTVADELHTQPLDEQVARAVTVEAAARRVLGAVD